MGKFSADDRKQHFAQSSEQWPLNILLTYDNYNARHQRNGALVLCDVHVLYIHFRKIENLANEIK